MTVCTDWQEQSDAHRARVDDLLSAHEARQAAGTAHPVEDFLFTYYVYKPKQLRRWHPGLNHVIPDLSAPHARWQFYCRTADDSLGVDAAALLQQRGALVQAVARLVRATSRRAGVYGCFGMHEWAMVYRLAPEQIRHSSWPLRMSADEIADVVDERGLRCTHFDAYRFFAPAALGHNALTLTRHDQEQHEQPGCLHAGMDLYKWAYKLTPAVSSATVLAAFELARDIRYTDMQASPYDLRALGLEPIAVETASGRAEYVALQRQYTERAQALRQELLHVCDELLSATAVTAGPR